MHRDKKYHAGNRNHKRILSYQKRHGASINGKGSYGTEWVFIRYCKHLFQSGGILTEHNTNWRLLRRRNAMSLAERNAVIIFRETVCFLRERTASIRACRSCRSISAAGGFRMQFFRLIGSLRVRSFGTMAMRSVKTADRNIRRQTIIWNTARTVGARCEEERRDSMRQNGGQISGCERGHSEGRKAA